MILRRLGNKSKIASKIINNFPQHKIYQEPFFGAGGLFFYKTKVKYNFVNDIDSDVFNLFDVIIHNFDELNEKLKLMPIHSDLLTYWKENQETEKVNKALRFLFLSNYTLYGTGVTLRVNSGNSKKILLDEIWKVNKFLFDVQFANVDFRKFFEMYSLKPNERKTTLIYADPPYLSTINNYSESFTEKDSIDLFNCLEKSGCKWAMSEFNNDFILKQAKERNLNVLLVGDRNNLKNRRTEILITNYKLQSGFFTYNDIFKI